MDYAELQPIAALALAVAAGMASFLSPCVAPLLPGYIAFIAPDDAGSGMGSGGATTLPRATGFVAGFVLLFAALGAGAAQFSRALAEQRSLLELGGGLTIALLGLASIFDRSIVPRSVGTALQRRTSTLDSPTSALAAMPVGAAFAVAWSPCIGPALAAILTLAAGTAQPIWGATLLVAYGIGLGIPFIAGAVALTRVRALSRAAQRHARSVRVGSGAILLVLGCAIATGTFGLFTAQLARVVPGWLP